MDAERPGSCPGEGPLRHADCAGCNCPCHWLPEATADEIADLAAGRNQ